jgi:hypothetical protein
MALLQMLQQGQGGGPPGMPPGGGGMPPGMMLPPQAPNPMDAMMGAQGGGQPQLPPELMQMLMGAQGGGGMPPMPPGGPMDVPAPMTNLPPNDPTGGIDIAKLAALRAKGLI